MDTRKQQTMSTSENFQNKSKERKIYPITGEMIDRAEELSPERVRKYLEEYRKNPPSWWND